MALNIKLKEKKDGLEKVEDTIRSKVRVIIENWCLIRQAELNPKHEWNHHHWIDELRDCLNDCLDVIEDSPYSARAIHNRVDWAFTRKPTLANDSNWVFRKLRNKLIDSEGLDEKQLKILADEWCKDGFNEVMSVLKGEKDTVDYIMSKRSNAPYRKPRKR